MLRVTDVQVGADGTRGVVWEEGDRRGTLELSIGGRHNLLNALAAAAAARALGAEWPDIFGALADFAGVGRRFQTIGEAAGVLVIDDYAHHPTEVTAALRAVRSMYGERRLVAAFQPHLYSRTRDFATEFGTALALADVVWITDVFPAREAPIPGITGRTVVEAAQAAGVAEVRYVEDLDRLAGEMAGTLGSGDVVLTLGAGSIEILGQRLVDTLREPAHA